MPASCGEADVVKAGEPAASNSDVQVSWLLLKTVGSVSMSRFWKTSLCETRQQLSAVHEEEWLHFLVGASNGGEVSNGCPDASVKMSAGKQLAI